MNFPKYLYRYLLSLFFVFLLYLGLNKIESRIIYSDWDKILHAAVFFIIWWLGRWSSQLSWYWITILTVVAGGLEEVHQIFQEGHIASLQDWYADILGVLVSVAIYLSGKGLLALQASIALRDEPALPQLKKNTACSSHTVNCRWTLKIWRWEFYLVILAGRERRALSSRGHFLAQVSVWVLMICFALVTVAIVVVVLLLIQIALGWHSFPIITDVLVYIVG